MAMRSPVAQHRVADADLAGAEVDRQLAGAGDRRAAHAAGDQRGVRGLAALGGEDPARRVEARDVVGLGERAHEDDVPSRGVGLDRLLGGEHDLALRGARRGGHARGQHGVLGVGVERRVQQRVELLGVDRRQRLAATEQASSTASQAKRTGGLGGRLALRVCSMYRRLLDGELVSCMSR
jgi:hypothetical protein